MSARIAPEAVSDELLDLTLKLAEPARDLVILSEGNTSELVGDEIVVKASGSAMGTATRADFVSMAVDPLVELLRDPGRPSAVTVSPTRAGRKKLVLDSSVTVVLPGGQFAKPTVPAQ